MLGENVFEIESNELEFNEICSNLRSHPFLSPWKMFFKSKDKIDGHNTEVSEFLIDSTMEIDQNVSTNHIQNDPETLIDRDMKNYVLFEEKKVSRLKESMFGVDDTTTVDDLKDVDLFFTVSANELPTLFNLLDIQSLNDVSVTLLLNAFLHYKDRISMTTASALVRHVICPIIFEIKKNSLRSLLSTILQFSEVYPKAVIDEMIIPYLRDRTLDDQQLEFFSKIFKAHLPDDYVAYCIKNVLDNAKPVESYFSVLQNLIERKVSHEKILYDQLLKKLLSWTQRCCNNVKFTKLMTSILFSYGSEFNQQHIQLCEDVIKVNKTIVKKAAENLLKKLKEDNM